MSALLAALISLGTACNRELRGETRVSAVSVPVQQIYHTATSGPAIREKVAIELSASWPIPVRSPEGYAFKFFYYRLSGPPIKQHFDVFPPAMVADIDADGKPAAIIAVSPASFGLRAAADAPLAEHSWPDDWTQDQINARVQSLISAYDRMIPFWLGQGSASEPRARTFRAQFLELTEPALLPYYRALAPEFFGWLGIP